MKNKIENWTIGSDPEVFLKNIETGAMVSSIGIVGGTKNEPTPMGDGFFCQEDNVLAEFNIPPAKTKEEFVNNITTGLNLLYGRLPKGVGVAIEPFAFFDKETLNNEKAMEFGCSPDLSCWTLEENQKPEAANYLLRTGGGHISVGWENHNENTAIELARFEDVTLAVPSIFMSDEAPRRELYGKAGAMRFTSFGMEYRTLSNFWIKSKELIEWAYEQVDKAISFVNKGVELSDKDKYAVIHAINNGNEAAAKYLIRKYDLVVL